MKSSQLKVITLVFHEKLRPFAQRASSIGVKECRWRENKDGTVTARFIMEAGLAKRFSDAADEFGFDPEETLRNFDSYRTSSDASVRQEDEDLGGRDDLQDVDTDGMGEAEDAEGLREPDGDEAPPEGELGEDSYDNIDQTEIGQAIDQGDDIGPENRERGTGDPFLGKTGGAFGEADTSLPTLSRSLGVEGNSLAVDTRPSKISQPAGEPNEGVGGEIAKDVKSIISKEGVIAPRSFKVPGFKIKVEGGKDRIRVVPKKTVAKR